MVADADVEKMLMNGQLEYLNTNVTINVKTNATNKHFFFLND